MDDLAFIHERVPEYNGDYSGESRHQTDEFLRAYVGERLSALRDRVGSQLDDSARKTLDDLILRCQFTDQTFIRCIDHVHLEGAALANVQHVDRELVELADRAETADVAELPDIFTELEAAFARRHEAGLLSRSS